MFGLIYLNIPYPWPSVCIFLQIWHLRSCSLSCGSGEMALFISIKLTHSFDVFRLKKCPKNQKDFLKRSFWLSVNLFISIVTVWSYALFGTAFTIIPSKYQWILALVSPLFREFYTRIYKYISYKQGKTWLIILEVGMFKVFNPTYSWKWNCALRIHVYSLRWGQTCYFPVYHPWRGSNVSQYLHSNCNWFLNEHFWWTHDCTKT